MWVKLGGEWTFQDRRLFLELLARCAIPVEGLGLPRSPELATLETGEIVRELACHPRAATADAPTIAVSDVTQSAERFISALRERGEQGEPSRRS